MTMILVSAGDLSGERYAGELVDAIRKRRPESRFVGMGGAAMASVGVELVVDQRELAVGGIFEALSSLGRIFRAWREMTRCLREREPDLVILVDSGGFNLPFARLVRRLGRAKIFYYVAPQVWAWREGRLRVLAECTDRIAVILPFEKEYYALRGVDVDFVGHPILGSRSMESSVSISVGERRDSARNRLDLDPGASVIALYPGSRRSEIESHLALWIDSFRILLRDRPELKAVIVRAPSLDREDFEARVIAAAEDIAGSIVVATGDTQDSLDAADVALAKPGTITLELLLRGCPMVVAGRVNSWTSRIVRRSLKANYFSMPNLLMEKEIVPELIQEEACAEHIAGALSPLFEGPARAEQVEALLGARQRLGSRGAAERGALIVEELLGSASA